MEILFNRIERKMVLKALLCVFAIGVLFVPVVAQQYRPDLPSLSFGVRPGGIFYQPQSDIVQNDWWPDSRIWTVPSNVVGEDTLWKDVLVPVFISNTWYNFNNVPGVVFDEISSFSFRVYYDERVLQFMEVVKQHPYTREEAMNLASTHFYRQGSDYYQPFAEHFGVQASVEKANDYIKYFDVNDTTYNVRTNNEVTRVGSIVTVTGTAFGDYKLPYTNSEDPDDKKVLVYLRFKVLPLTTSPVGAERLAKLYFDPTYILYNGVNITQDYGYKLLKDYPTTSADPNYTGYTSAFSNSPTVLSRNDNMKYFNKDWNTDKKLAEVERKSVGIQIYQNYSNTDKYQADMYLPGSIDVRVMNTYPEFRFNIFNPTSTLTANARIVQNPNDLSTWTLTEQVLADNLANRPGNYLNRVERGIDISIVGDNIATMENIIVESDQPWLRFRGVASNTTELDISYENKFGTLGTMNQLVRRGFMQRINNLITTDNAYNPFPSDILLDINKPKNMRIYLDLNQEGLTPGVYYGYLTFKSAFDKFSPTRIQVKFIVAANPEERANAIPGTVVQPYGIILKVTPFNGTRTDLTKTLLIGSAENATDFADTLYAEYERSNPLGFDRFNTEVEFDARLFIDTLNYYPIENATPADSMYLRRLANYGFGDLAHLDGYWNNSYIDNRVSRADSRDIRSSRESGKSHYFYVKYDYRNSADIDFYPVLLTWDANQFNTPNGNKQNTIYLKYNSNGVTHTLDMRSEATPIGNNQFSFTFTDKNVKEFWIEYTIGQEQAADLLDNFGDPMIVPNAWNFVSLPLNPVNKYYTFTFPNAMTIPYQYSLNAWQQPIAGNLVPGVAYYVKYSNLIDKQFYGAFFHEVSINSFPQYKDHLRVYPGNANEGGWNAVGALSVPVDISTGIAFDEFSATENPDIEYTLGYGVWAYRPKKGYDEVSALFPGKGYWIKVDKNGYYNIRSTGAKAVANTTTQLQNRTAGFDVINIADAEQNNTDIYTAKNIDANMFNLPPVPPAGMFDVRYSNNNYAANYGENIVLLQGVSYPVNVTFNNPKANYQVIDPISGEIYGKVKAGQTSNVVINNAKANSFKLIAEGSDKDFFVSVANNPVITNNVEFSFGVINNGFVTISVYNAVGNEVARIDAGELPSGIHNRNLDITNLSSGSYTIRMTSGTDATVSRMNIVK